MFLQPKWHTASLVAKYISGGVRTCAESDALPENARLFAVSALTKFKSDGKLPPMGRRRFDRYNYSSTEYESGWLLGLLHGKVRFGKIAQKHLKK